MATKDLLHAGSDPFIRIGLDVQKNMVNFLSATDKRNFVLTNRRFYHAFHPNYLMLSYLAETLEVGLENALSQFPTGCIIVSWDRLSMYKQLFERAKAAFENTDTFFRQELFPLTVEMKEGETGTQLLDAIIRIGLAVSNIVRIMMQVMDSYLAFSETSGVPSNLGQFIVVTLRNLFDIIKFCQRKKNTWIRQWAVFYPYDIEDYSSDEDE